MLLEDLTKEIAKGRVVAIIGAGVSIGASGNHPCASWTGLLGDGVNHCEGLGSITPGEARLLGRLIIARTYSTILQQPGVRWARLSVL